MKILFYLSSLAPILVLFAFWLASYFKKGPAWMQAVWPQIEKGAVEMWNHIQTKDWPETKKRAKRSWKRLRVKTRRFSRKSWRWIRIMTRRRGRQLWRHKGEKKVWLTACVLGGGSILYFVILPTLRMPALPSFSFGDLSSWPVVLIAVLLVLLSLGSWVLVGQGTWGKKIVAKIHVWVAGVLATLVTLIYVVHYATRRAPEVWYRIMDGWAVMWQFIQATITKIDWSSGLAWYNSHVLSPWNWIIPVAAVLLVVWAIKSKFSGHHGGSHATTSHGGGHGGHGHGGSAQKIVGWAFVIILASAVFETWTRSRGVMATQSGVAEQNPLAPRKIYVTEIPQAVTAESGKSVTWILLSDVHIMVRRNDEAEFEDSMNQTVRMTDCQCQRQTLWFRTKHAHEAVWVQVIFTPSPRY